MKELEKNINKLEKEVKKITHSKQKKHMSPETMQYFSDVLNGIDELNRDVLGYKGTNIYLDVASVGATINLMIAATKAEGLTTITNAAREPEIEDLAKFLNKMGAKIEGAGTNNIKITGVKHLKEVGYKIMPDRIEAGTYLCMVATTGGKIKLLDAEPEHITPILHKLQECRL